MSPEAKASLKDFFLPLFVAIIVLVSSYGLIQKARHPQEEPAAEWKVGARITLTSSAACVSHKDTLGKLAKWARLNDREELGRLLVADYGEILPAGTQVKILELDWRKALIRVIRASERECWTTVPE